MTGIETIEMSFRIDEGLDPKLVEQIQAYSAFLAAAEMAGPQGGWLARLT